MAEQLSSLSDSTSSTGDSGVHHKYVLEDSDMYHKTTSIHMSYYTLRVDYYMYIHTVLLVTQASLSPFESIMLFNTCSNFIPQDIQCTYKYRYIHVYTDKHFSVESNDDGS